MHHQKGAGVVLYVFPNFTRSRIILVGVVDFIQDERIIGCLLRVFEYWIVTKRYNKMGAHRNFIFIRLFLRKCL